MGQLEVRLEAEAMQVKSERPTRVEMVEMPRVPMRIRAAVAEAPAKPVAVAEVLRRLKQVQAAAAAVPH